MDGYQFTIDGSTQGECVSVLILRGLALALYGARLPPGEKQNTMQVQLDTRARYVHCAAAPSLSGRFRSSTSTSS